MPIKGKMKKRIIRLQVVHTQWAKIGAYAIYCLGPIKLNIMDALETNIEPSVITMDQKTLRGIVYDLRHHRTEFHDVEVKAANNDNPNELWKTFSAFANYSKPGIIICGLDEDSGFKVVDIYNPSKLQEHIISVASQMEPVLCPDITVDGL